MATVRSRHVKEPFEIHHDEMDESMEQNGTADDSRIDDGEGEQMEADGFSEASDETDEAVDVFVQRDMEKFQHSFEDMNERFRLINRIGEGKLAPTNSLVAPLLTSDRNIFDGIQGRGSLVRGIHQ